MSSNQPRSKDGSIARNRVKTLFIVLIAASGLFGGCACLSLEEAEARRMESLREAHPAAYELERRQQLEDRQRDNAILNGWFR